MLRIWEEMGLFEIEEQKLADQAHATKVNGWLSELELENIKRKRVEKK